MMNRPEEKILDHEYDGIREFDNPLPRWWLLTFYITIVFSVIYFAYYQLGPGPSPTDELSAELSEIQSMVAVNAPKEVPVTEEQMNGIYADASRRKLGEKTFVDKCASCHAVDGGGTIGPNLTDHFWIHGKGTMIDILNVVSEGVLDKGMPPWKTMLKKEELQNVVAFVHSLLNTKPANPKAPQGNEVK